MCKRIAVVGAMAVEVAELLRRLDSPVEGGCPVDVELGDPAVEGVRQALLQARDEPDQLAIAVGPADN